MRRRALSEKWFRRIVRLLPRRFRTRHQAPMEQLFRDQLRESANGRDLAALWSRTLRDLVRVAPREHLRELVHDGRVAFRGMRKDLVVSAVAAATLALGIGANATLFGVVNAVLLRPLPFEHGERLTRIYITRDGQPPYLSPTRPILFDEVTRQIDAFDAVVAQRYTDVTVGGGEDPQRVAAMAVTAGWRDVLGIDLTLGRDFSPEEEELGLSADVVLVSHGFWSERLGGGEAALGSELVVDGRRRVVIGVLPRGFRFPYDNDLWFPINLARDRDGVWGLNIQARLRPGASLSEARTQLAVLASRLGGTHPDVLRGMQLTAIPTREVLLDDGSGLVLVLLGAVGLVLLLIAVNVGNLLLARTLSRRSELAIRTALGASRLRQARQLLTESLALALVGGAGGLALAFAATRFAAGLVPGRMAFLLDGIPLDGAVLLFTLGTTLAVGLLFGAAPAWRATGRHLEQALRSGRLTASAERQRFAVALVVGEIALALVVLVGAGSLVGFYLERYGEDLGYDASRILTATVPLDREPYDSGARRDALVRETLERVEALPGVAAVGATCLFPSPNGNFLAEIEVEGRPVDPESPLTVNHRLVTPGFFRALDLRLERGRLFTGLDAASSSPVAIVSARAARRFFPGEDPVGRRLRSLRDPEGTWVTVVGVVADVREFDEIDETWYLPYAQRAEDAMAGQAVFTVRTLVPPETLLPSLRAALRESDPGLPLFDVGRVSELYRESLANERLSAVLSALFAAFGLLMAALGIGGVMAYAVSQRRREYGVRVALGARPRDLLWSVLGRGALWTAAGIGLGIAASVFVHRALGALVPDLEGLAVLPLAGVCVLLAAVALAACYAPARRAVRVDPLVALRTE